MNLNQPLRGETAIISAGLMLLFGNRLSQAGTCAKREHLESARYFLAEATEVLDVLDHWTEKSR